MEFGDIFGEVVKEPLLSDCVEPIKLSISHITYWVNEKTKVVGCKMRYHIKGDDNVLDMCLALGDNRNNLVVAEAHLAPGDTFDVETGKRIARAKAESMAYKSAMSYLNGAADKALCALNQIDDFLDKAEGVLEHNDKYLATF